MQPTLYSPSPSCPLPHLPYSPQFQSPWLRSAFQIWQNSKSDKSSIFLILCLPPCTECQLRKHKSMLTGFTLNDPIEMVKRSSMGHVREQQARGQPLVQTSQPPRFLQPTHSCSLLEVYMPPFPLFQISPSGLPNSHLKNVLPLLLRKLNRKEFSDTPTPFIPVPASAPTWSAFAPITSDGLSLLLSKGNSSYALDPTASCLHKPISSAKPLSLSSIINFLFATVTFPPVNKQKLL